MAAWIIGISMLLGAEPQVIISQVPALATQNVVVVCPEQLQNGLTAWITARRKSNWDVQVVTPRNTAQETLGTIKQLGKRASYVVLVGNCQLPSIAAIDPRWQTPTFYAETPIAARFGSTENAATDLPYGDIDGDGIPEASVGRLPANDAAGLAKLLDRSLAAEDNQDFGTWRRQVHLVAGVGNFGILADTAIEAATGGLIQTLLPGGVHTTVLYASERSPFFPGLEKFRHQAIERYSEGGLAWVYVGHGQVTELDRVPSGPAGVPILSISDVDGLRAPPQSPPLAVLLACYTGAFDARSDCIAESMVMADGGPVAAIAGTRVTMPYGNASLAAALMDAWFQDHVPCLGDILAESRRRLLMADDLRRPKLLDTLAGVLSPNAEQLSQERQEHASLYNLLGDPTMTLRHAEPLTLKGPSRAAPGDQLDIVVTGMKPGPLSMELCLPLGKVRRAAQGAQGDDATILDRCVLEATDQPCTAKLKVPANVSGDCIVRGFCSSKRSYGIGAMQIRVIPTGAANR